MALIMSGSLFCIGFELTEMLLRLAYMTIILCVCGFYYVDECLAYAFMIVYISYSVVLHGFETKSLI